MAHKLNLGMYSFRIKEKNKADTETCSIDDFLKDAYPNEADKFLAFSNHIIKPLGSLYKTTENDLGALLIDHNLDSKRRIIDIMIEGGITGIKQSLISSPKTKQPISPDETVGLRFFIRFWMQQSNAGYVFIQSYSNLSIRKLIQEVLANALKKTGFTIVRRNIEKTTTKKRMNEFLANSKPIAVSIINKTSDYDPANTKVDTARITLRGDFSTKELNRKDIKNLAKSRHGIELSDSEKYSYQVTYRTKNDRGDNEDRSVTLETDLKDVNLIPNIVVPQECIDDDNYPILKKMKGLCDAEIQQILQEISGR